MGRHATHITAEELFQLDGDQHRTELVAGKLVHMEPPGLGHAIVASRLGTVLTAHVEAHGLGLVLTSEVGFVLARDPDTVRAPDVSFITASRFAEIGVREDYVPGPPDVAVEVVSPNDRRSEVEAKALEWLAAGTRAVVVIEPRLRTATVYRSRSDIRILTADEVLDLGDIITGFSTPLDALFDSPAA